MSNYKDLYDKPTVLSNDSVVSTESVEAINDKTDLGFVQVSDVLGNLHGKGDGINVVEDSELKINTVSATIGDASKISAEKPFGSYFSNYSQNFNDITRKDFTLDLVPDIGGAIVIASPSDPSITWNRVLGAQDFSDIGDFTVDGRNLIFYKQPSGAFTIQYDGIFPVFGTEFSNGYRPNVYPSPELLEAHPELRPELAFNGNGRYKITFTKTNKNNRLEIFGSNLNLGFNPILLNYISSSSYIPVPQEYISIWVKREDEDYFSKMECINIFIMSDYEVEIDTEEAIDLQNDTLILVLSNVSITDMLQATTELLFKHNHDQHSITSQINHAALQGLIPVSDKTGVLYGGSLIKGNDHPQYLNREGYNPLDVGTQGNGMVGDLAMLSTDPASAFNNILADSNRIFFGSSSNGVSLKYKASSDALLVYSAANGLELETYDPIGSQGKNSFCLSLNGHQLFNYKIAGVPYLSIGSSSKKIRFSNNAGDELADIIVNKVSTDDAEIAGDAVVTDSGSIIISEIKFAHDALVPGLEVTSANPAKKISVVPETTFADINIILGEATTFKILTQFVLPTNAKLAFGGDLELATNYLEVATVGTETTLQLVSEVGFRIKNTGRRKGLNLGDTITDEYASLYAAASGGAGSTPSDSDVYLESHLGGIYMLKSTNKDHVQDDRIYRWKTGSPDERVDNLKEWPRSNLFAGIGSFRYVNVGLSNLTEKKGVQFGLSNSIYVTGPGTACPTGWMVLESQNGVVLVNSSSDATDCSSLSYNDLTAGDIQSFGSIISQKDLSAGQNLIVSNKSTTKSLEVTEALLVGEDARIKGELTVERTINALSDVVFKTNIEILGEANIKTKLITGLMEVNGLATFNELARFSAAMDVDGDLTLGGTLRVDGRGVFNSRLSATEFTTDLAIMNEATVKGAFKTESSAEIAGNLQVNGNLSTNLAIFSELGFSTPAFVNSKTLNVSGDAAVAQSLTVEGETRLRDDVQIGATGTNLTVNADSTFTSPATFTQGMEVFGATEMGGNLNVNGGTTLNAAVSILSRLSVVGETTIDANTSINGELTTSYLSVENSSEFLGPIVAKAGATLSSASVTDDFAVSGTSIFTGEVSFNDRVKVYGSSEFSGTIVSNASVEIKSALSVVGAINCSASITAATGSVIAGSLQVINNSNFQKSAVFQATVQVESLIVDNNALINGDLSVAQNISCDFIRILSGFETAALDVFGTANFHGTLNARSEVFFKSTLELSGKLTVKSEIEAQGAISGESLSISDTSSFEGNAVFEANLQADAITVSNNITSGRTILAENIRANSGFEAGTGSISTFATTNVIGAFTQSSPNQLFTVAGDAKFAKSLEVPTATITSVLNIGTGNSLISIGSNKIEVGSATTRGKIFTGELYATKIFGQEANVYIPSEAYATNPSLALALNNQKFVKIDNTYVENVGVFRGPVLMNGELYVNAIKRLTPKINPKTGIMSDAIELVAMAAYYDP